MNRLVAAASYFRGTVGDRAETAAFVSGVFLRLLFGAPSRGVLFLRVHAQKELGGVPINIL